MTTATPPADLDLDSLITATTAEIEKLSAERSKLALASLRKAPGADKAFTRCEGHLAVARRVLSQAQAATLAFASEKTAEAEALSEAEIKRLQAERESAEQALGKRMVQAEEQIQSLVNVIGVTLEASDRAYNSAVALGIHGNALATSDRIAARINHVLNLAGMHDFDFSMSPSGRQPLSGAAPESTTVVAPPGPASGDFSSLHVVAESESEPESEPESLADLKAEAIKRASRTAKRPVGTLRDAVEAMGR